MMTWKKVEPYQGTIHQGCANCGAVERVALMSMVIAVGFGVAQVLKDSEIIYSEPHNLKDIEELPRLQKFEDMASADPDHDWRVILDAPLRNREYQRHDVGKWVLIASGRGFA